MDTPMVNLAFSGMSFFFKLRYFLFPPRDILQEVGIEPGFHVLDYGCGPGGYLLDTVELVGESGMVYALDIHPLAVQKVKDIVKKKGLANVKTICSGCHTGLPDNSIDVVLLYDVFHMLSEPEAVLSELHRVLKQDGILSFTADHMQRGKAISSVTEGRLFRLSKEGGKTLGFSKQE